MDYDELIAQLQALTPEQRRQKVKVLIYDHAYNEYVEENASLEVVSDTHPCVTGKSTTAFLSVGDAVIAVCR